MTVERLIEILKQYPEKQEVFIADPGHEFLDIAEVGLDVVEDLVIYTKEF